MSDARIQQLIADICLRADADEALQRDPRGFVEHRGIAADDAEALVESAPRLTLYRELVQENLRGVIRKMMPRTTAWLDAVHPGAFEHTFAEFLDQAAPRTPYFRDVPAEFLAWATPRWSAANDDLPAWIADLARHELTAFTVAAAPALPPPEGTLGELTLDRPLVFTDAKALARYAFAVHELPATLDAADAPAQRDVAVLVYRDPLHEVRYLELSPLACAVLESLFEGAPLAAAVQNACTREGIPTDPAVLEGTARLLADLGARGVLLGSRLA